VKTLLTNRPSNDSRGAAFSLIEIMVAVGLLAVIIVALLAMFYQTQRAFRSGLTQVDILESGRAAMELITRDLQEAVASMDTSTANSQRTNVVSQFVQRTNLISRLAVGFSPLQLANQDLSNVIQNVSFLRRFNDDWIGEAYRVSNAVAGVGTLYRLVVTTNREAVAGPGDFVGSLPSIEGNPNPNFARVADGVVHFRIVPFDPQGVFATNGPASAIGGDSCAFWNDGLPSYVDVELALLEPRSLEQFRSKANQANATAYLQKQAGRMHFFKQRVQLRNAPQTLSNSP